VQHERRVEGREKERFGRGRREAGLRYARNTHERRRLSVSKVSGHHVRPSVSVKIGARERKWLRPQAADRGRFRQTKATRSFPDEKEDGLKIDGCGKVYVAIGIEIDSEQAVWTARINLNALPLPKATVAITQVERDVVIRSDIVNSHGQVQ
jgi:hypothetical protein